MLFQTYMLFFAQLNTNIFFKNINASQIKHGISFIAYNMLKTYHFDLKAATDVNLDFTF